MEHLQSLRSFYPQQHNTQQTTKAMIIIIPHSDTETIILSGRKDLLEGFCLSLRLFIDCAWSAAEEAGKGKKGYFEKP